MFWPAFAPRCALDPPGVPAGYDIILATGDSNKYNGATLDGGLDVVDSSVKYLLAGAEAAAQEPLDYQPEGVTASKIGHDVHFAIDYYKANGLLLGSRKVLIVPVAKGGSASYFDAASEWALLGGTTGTPTTDGTGGDSLIPATLSPALTDALALGGGTNTTKAVLHMEGVNAYSSYGNTFQAAVLSTYRWRLHRTIQALRNLVGATVPILVCRMTKDAINAAGGDYSTNGVVVDRMLQAIPRNFPYTGCADSQSPTELGGDGISAEVHFTAAEQRTLAARYYTAYVAALANTGRTVTWDPDVMLAADGFTAGYTLGNSNLDLSGDANSNWKTARTTGPSRGSTDKLYIEIKVQAAASVTNLGMLGLCNADFNMSQGVYLGQGSNGGATNRQAAHWGIGNNDTVGWTKTWTGTMTWAANDIIQLAIDRALGYAWIGKNNTWQNSGDPAAGTNPWVSGIATDDVVYVGASIYTGTGNTWRLQPTSASQTYSPPSGFSAWGA